MKYLYAVLRAIVSIILVLEMFNRAWYNAFLCFVTLVLFTVPHIVEHRAKINIPDPLEIVILIFIFAAEILGEIQDFYYRFPYWDTILHCTNGFLCASIGLALINILNDSPKTAFNLSPFYVALAAFCFSMTIGVLWEFFEFAMDSFFHTNMQKDTLLANGYVDLGLIDTMQDLIVDFVGAFLFSIIGYFYVKHPGQSRLVPLFMLTRAPTNTIEAIADTSVADAPGLGEIT